MYGYIYKTINNINGKIYIGKHKSVKYDNSYYGSGKILKQAILKYGIENFSNILICVCNSKSELDKMEKYFIKEYNSNDLLVGYNISEGGDGGDTFSGLSNIDKQLRIKKLQKNSYFANITKEQDKCMRIKSWQTRRKNGNDKFSEESKIKMSESHKGKTPTKEQIQKMLKTKGEYHHSDETKEKIRNSNKGKKKNFSKETINKLSERGKHLTGENNPFFGKHHKEETKKLIGEKCGMKMKETKWMNNGEKSLRVSISDIDKYKKLGFVLGRKGWKNV